MIDGTVMNRTLPLFLLLIVGVYISCNIFYPFITLIEKINDGKEINSHLLQLLYEIFGTVDILIHPRHKKAKEVIVHFTKKIQ